MAGLRAGGSTNPNTYRHSYKGARGNRHSDKGACCHRHSHACGACGHSNAYLGGHADLSQAGSRKAQGRW